MAPFFFAVWLLAGGLVYVWFVGFIFSVITRRFLYRGKAGDSSHLIFQITTKECPETVHMACASIVQSCSKVGFGTYQIWVVTDNPDPPRFEDSRIRLIAVPPEFQCGTRYKARSLEYARRERTNAVYSGWIYFMDEENWVTEQTVRAITSFAEQGSAKIGSGPLMFRSGGSKLAWLGDSIRTAECRMCHLGHSIGRWPVHGENLLLNSEVENDIGWQFTALTEDVEFSAHADKKGYTTGWHGGVLYSTSPSSLNDFVRQRRRWFRGMLQCARDGHIGIGYRALVSCLLLGWLLAIILIIGIVVNLFHSLGPPSFFWYWVCIALTLFSIGYYTGCHGRFYDRLLALGLCWAFVILESISAWTSLVGPPRNFEVVRKTCSKAQGQE